MIREAATKDLEVITEWVKKEFHTTLSTDVFTKYLIYADEEIVGFLSYSIMYERAEINYIFVLPEFRKNKIASKLLEKMNEELLEKKIETVTLEVRITNEEAINLYQKNGFKIVSVRKNYYQDADGYLMVKDLIK